jgi:hypothetical protein
MKNRGAAMGMLLLSGCGVMPSANQDASSALIVDREVPPLSRAEVIAGISECEKSGMRPIVLTTKRKVNNQIIPSVWRSLVCPG